MKNTVQDFESILKKMQEKKSQMISASITEQMLVETLDGLIGIAISAGLTPELERAIRSVEAKIAEFHPDSDNSHIVAV